MALAAMATERGRAPVGQRCTMSQVASRPFLTVICPPICTTSQGSRAFHSTRPTAGHSTLAERAQGIEVNTPNEWGH
jgi:hypothetical protein